MIALTILSIVWLVLAKAVYDNIREHDKLSARWKIACFAAIGPPIILWGALTRLLRKA